MPEDITPMSGPDDDGWYTYKTPKGVVIKLREHPDGRVDFFIPKGDYEVKDVYEIESTGEIAIDFKPKPKNDEKKEE